MQVLIHLSEHVNLAELDIQQVVFQSYGQHSYLKRRNLLNLAVPRGCLRFVIVVFPDHTHYFLCKRITFVSSFIPKRI